MHSLLSTPNPRPRLASVTVSILVHLGVVGALLMLAGPVWQQVQPRVMARLEMPRLPSPKLKLLPRVTARLPRLPAPVADAPVRRTLEVPVRTVEAPTRRVVIEAPEVAGAPPIPVVQAPVIAAAPLKVVQVGMLETGAPTLAAAPGRQVSDSGFGTAAAGAGTGGRRHVVTAGFGGEGLTASTGGGRQVRETSFDASEPSRAIGKPKAVSPESLEILDKPRPVYTAEARRLRIEGTVELRVVFSAAGRIRVVQVVRGLGHGLDEAAIEAAQGIRYKPARRDGQPVDQSAVIQIQFQLA